MLSFENAYAGTPSWEIGRPQPAVVRLAEGGEIQGDVLEVGCGTGEASLYLAARGLTVTAIDFSPTAIERARKKAAERELLVEFIVADALDLPALGRAFDSAIDVGLFHCLQPADRRRYADGLAAVLRPGGRLFILAWSDRNPFGRGPQRISKRDLRRAFGRGWVVESIEPDLLESNLPEDRIYAWLARLRRRG